MVVLDNNIATKSKYTITYGTRSGRGLDVEASMVTTVPFCMYMDNFPDEKNGLWGVVERILECKINIDEFRRKYANAKWNYR